MNKKHSVTTSIMDDLEAISGALGHQGEHSKAGVFHKILRRFARWQPTTFVVIVASALFLASMSYTAIALALGTHEFHIDWIATGFLTASVAAGMLLMPFLQEIHGSTVKRGFLFINPAEVPVALIALLLSPVLVLPAVMIGTLMLWIKVPPKRYSINIVNLTSLVVPWVTTGILFQTYHQTFAGIEQVLFLCGCIAVGMIATVAMPAILFAGLNGELQLVKSFTVFTAEIAAFLWLIFAAVSGFIYDPILAGFLVIAGYIVLTAMQVAASHYSRAHEYRALSYGLVATIMHLLKSVDDRLQRHSLNTARYSRDIVQASGLNQAVQELAFMAGFLHDLGLAGLGKKLRVAEEEFLRDDSPPDDPTPRWWYPPGTDSSLSEEDVQILDKHPAIIAQLFKSSHTYGDLPTILERHHEPQPRNRANFVAIQIINAIRVADKYESLTAVDGSLPPMHHENAIEFLRFYTEDDGELNKTTVDVFERLLTQRPSAYRNGTDLTYEESPADFLDDSLPGPLNLWGLKQDMVPRLSDQILKQYKANA